REQGLSEGSDVLALLKDEITNILSQKPPSSPVADNSVPAVWLILGVNGVGKTTTIGKLATSFASRGSKVMIAACDTFRAAAIDQVAIWAERSGVEIIKSREGADPASVAFDAANAALARKADLLLVDTAGRLHTKTNLMEELKKIKRVIARALPAAPIISELIIDGTTGQNALSQVRVFTDAVGCDGVIVTKLDGTAKGGVIIAVTEELGVPVDYIGLGESIDDLQPFDPKQFAEALFA
ncbi:MAG: signal recognition particle-docking protein FtsY, partial [candidate division Zixibacteria bacterium]|nr:signal recognition particle-docking protein FtsY [candidate division Zixibacteria bacterium]